MSNISDANLAILAAKEARDAAVAKLANARDNLEQLSGVIRSSVNNDLSDVRALISAAGSESSEITSPVNMVDEKANEAAQACHLAIEAIDSEIRELNAKEFPTFS